MTPLMRTLMRFVSNYSCWLSRVNPIYGVSVTVPLSKASVTRYQFLQHLVLHAEGSVVGTGQVEGLTTHRLVTGAAHAYLLLKDVGHLVSALQVYTELGTKLHFTDESAVILVERVGDAVIEAEEECIDCSIVPAYM